MMTRRRLTKSGAHLTPSTELASTAPRRIRRARGGVHHVATGRSKEERLQESEEEGDEDGERPEWLNPSFFLWCQEGISAPCRAATEEIFAFAMNPAVYEPWFTEFLAGYSGGDLNEGDCVDLIMRMAEEGLTLGSVHLF
jgi:hypothetical protein